MPAPTAPASAPLYTRDIIRGYLQARPFRPFKLHMLNGRVFNVRAHDDLWVGLGGSLVFDSGRGDLGFSDLDAIAEIKFGRAAKSTR